MKANKIAINVKYDWKKIAWYFAETIAVIGMKILQFFLL